MFILVLGKDRLSRKNLRNMPATRRPRDGSLLLKRRFQFGEIRRGRGVNLDPFHAASYNEGIFFLYSFNLKVSDNVCPTRPLPLPTHPFSFSFSFPFLPLRLFSFLDGDSGWSQLWSRIKGGVSSTKQTSEKLNLPRDD